MELALLPYVSVPSEIEQVDCYIGTLSEDMQMHVQDNADFEQIISIAYWMNRAKVIEALKATMNMRLNMRPNKTKAKDDVQKKRQSSGNNTTASKKTEEASSNPSK